MHHLILLHGALGSGDELGVLEKHLKNTNIQAHTFTFSGHGNKALKGDFGIERFSDELLDFISKENIPAPFVFGYSMGGFVALNVAINARTLFSGIVTLGTKFKWTEEFTAKERSKLNPEFLLEKAPDYAKQLLAKHGPGWTNLLSLTSEMMFDLQNSTPGFINSLDQIKIPVWIGRGEKDRMVSEEESLLIQQKIQGARYFVLPDSPHAFENINHQLLAEMVMTILGKPNSNEVPANG